ncbi:hypothetical protein JMA_39490 (plasmid) [Jeotgalibacillus malaysiensis]|uniref:Uncharacterized protein n=1 Tax=Jeotgalibacillus malaysiensis TaxID=1508404 RepID=A0A0B5AX42_9BACL|nr:hypothetical protein [Jeotgalibacillus malaysiensis]AJD93267.1 hypothetical protein JMA_39490 [Jeotgalibacillus malaysiensis]
MKKMLFIVSTTMMSLILVACSFISEGTIVEKKFTPAHVETSTSVVMSGKVAVPITNTNHVPDTWEIRVEGFNPETERTESRKVKVTKEEYENLNEGDYYVIPE